MDESTPRCPDCGQAATADEPCACQGGARSTFTLLPALDEVFEEEERFTRLLREVKRDVVRRDFVGEANATALEQQARRMNGAVTEGRVEDADHIAEEMVASVLQFPSPPKVVRLLESPRLLVTLGASILMAAIVAILVFGRG